MQFKAANRQIANQIVHAIENSVRCRDCPDQGWYAVQRGEGDIEQVQCEFCYTVPNSMFNVLSDMAEKVTDLLDAKEALTASEARVRELEAALQHEIDNCVNCEGKGRYITHRKGGYEFTVSCERCASARSALGDVTATKEEAKNGT